MRTITFLILAFVILPLLAQYQTSWLVPLVQQPTSIRVIIQNKRQYVFIGLASGHIQIIQAHSLVLIKSLLILDEPITDIVDGGNGIILIVGLTKITYLDEQYDIAQVDEQQDIGFRQFKKPISSISLSQNSDSSYCNFKAGNCIHSFLYGQSNDFHFYDLVRICDSPSTSIVKMSYNHQYIYTVSQDQHSFHIYKMPPYPKPYYSSIIDLDSQELQKQIILSRRYNFKIKSLIIDQKSPPSQRKDEDLLMINEDETIFYLRSGNILTYIPYSTSDNQKLIAVEYCENMFIAIVHQKRSNNQSQSYLTLIRKDNLFSQKVILLNSHYGNNRLSVQKMDCNHNLIVIQTQDKNLLIFQSYKVFQIEEYFRQIVSMSLLIIILLIVLYCRKATRHRKIETPKQAPKQANIPVGYYTLMNKQTHKQPLLSKKQQKKPKKK